MKKSEFPTKQWLIVFVIAELIAVYVSTQCRDRYQLTVVGDDVYRIDTWAGDTQLSAMKTGSRVWTNLSEAP
jgi:hypothetical protein